MTLVIPRYGTTRSDGSLGRAGASTATFAIGPATSRTFTPRTSSDDPASGDGHSSRESRSDCQPVVPPAASTIRN
jgi:hypothetical protein